MHSVTGLTWLFVLNLHVSVHVACITGSFSGVFLFACLPVEWKNGKLKWPLYLTHLLIVTYFWQWCFWVSCRDCTRTRRLCDWLSSFWSDASLKHVEHLFSSELNLTIFTVCFAYICDNAGITSFFVYLYHWHPHISLPLFTRFSSIVVLWFLPDPPAREAGLPVLL